MHTSDGHFHTTKNLPDAGYADTLSWSINQTSNDKISIQHLTNSSNSRKNK